MIEIEPYNPLWPCVFEKTAQDIQQSLGTNCVSIHHIGSTAVPGLAAKPKIDILCVVNKLSQAIAPLESLGFVYKGEYNIPLHGGFSRRGEWDFNLHAYEPDHPEITLNLLFRDYLRIHPVDRNAYEVLKRELANQQDATHKHSGSFNQEYTLLKGDRIRDILRKAGFSKMRMLQCNDRTEWATAKAFRKRYFPADDPYACSFGHPDHAHCVWYQGVDIIGYAHIHFIPEDRAVLRMIGIDESHRNCGFGSHFLSQIEKWLSHRGIWNLLVQSQPLFLNFYLKNGYVQTSLEDLKKPEPDPMNICLQKNLLKPF